MGLGNEETQEPKKTKGRRMEKKKQEGNMPASAVIFTCDSRQQISKDKIFHWMSGHILLCALNSQVFEVAAVSFKKKSYSLSGLRHIYVLEGWLDRSIGQP